VDLPSWEPSRPSRGSWSLPRGDKRRLRHEFFGLSLFLFGTGLIFWLIKTHFDYVDRSM